MTVVFVTGTGTDVGKTWALVRVLREWPTGARPAVVRKPAQSYAPDELGTTDAELLGAATGEVATRVCPPHRWYETPMAPPMAAAALGRPQFSVADLAGETRESVAADATLFVEGAGGPRSPLAADGDNVDLARALGARVTVLVADAGLGTINVVRLCVDALVGLDTVVLLNRFVATDGLHVANRDWLSGSGYQVVVSTPDLVDALVARVP